MWSASGEAKGAKITTAERFRSTSICQYSGIPSREPDSLQRGQEPEKEGTIMFANFMLENYWLAALDSAREHNFTFNEAISFMVYCDAQDEIDYYWERLSAVPDAEQCG